MSPAADDEGTVSPAVAKATEIEEHSPPPAKDKSGHPEPKSQPAADGEPEPKTDDGKVASAPTEAPSDSNEKGSPPPPPPPPKDEKFISRPEPLQLPGEKDPEKEAYAMAQPEVASPDPTGDARTDDGDDTRSEIQSIMEQFDEGMGGPGADEIMSPRMEIAGPLLGSPVAGHPPRKSSLEPLRSSSRTSLANDGSPSGSAVQSPPPRSSSLIGTPPLGLGIGPTSANDQANQSTTSLSLRQHAPLPPQPDPEPDLPFDFHRFLEQLRHRTANPVAKYLRSFLLEFYKKQWMVHEQVKIISDFLEFITKKMALCEVWQAVSDAEFDNACEGMEKLVMSRLFSQTFSPAIPPPDPALVGRKRRAGQAPPPGRAGQHQEDVERDEVLAQKVRIYSWVREEHLDIKPLNDKGRKFLSLAQQELLKIGNYRAPRDKVICILNSCKVIFGFLRNTHHDQSADSFVPLLIYTVLRANPPNLVSNVQYILRFRNANKLTGEAGYYISSLGGAIEFIERLDRTSLTISDAEFERNVEAAVSRIAEPHPPNAPAPAASILGTSPSASASTPPPVPPRLQPPPSISAAVAAAEAERKRDSSEGSGGGGGSGADELAAVAGLLRSIQRPLSTIGRIFSDDSPAASSSSTAPNNGNNAPSRRPSSVGAAVLPRTPPPHHHAPVLPPLTPQPAGQQQGHRRATSLLGVATPAGPTASLAAPPPTSPGDGSDGGGGPTGTGTGAEDAAARQASKEAEEARRIRAREESHVVETLCGMFPVLDREVVVDVVRANEGRIGSAVDACLALSS